MSSFLSEETLRAAPYILTCQKEPYLQEISTTVLACHDIKAWFEVYGKAASTEGATESVPTQNKKANKNKKKNKNKNKNKEKLMKKGSDEEVVEAKYAVLLADTILFPTGGGQPNDLGIISANGRKIRVLDVVRMPSDQRLVLHFVPEAISDGSEVHVSLDWERRFDHMQQHSAQHLITAIALPKWPTTTWCLTKKVKNECSPSYLDIDAHPSDISEDILSNLENLVNDKIRSNLAVTPQIYSPEEFDKISGVRSGSKGIKSGRGPIRTISIEGVDTNTCCGTHVCSTGHLQSVKLLKAEKSPASKNNTRIWFVAGNRLLDLVGVLHKTSNELSRVLTSAPSDHSSRVAEMIKNQKEQDRASKQLLRKHASMIANLAHYPDFLETNTIATHLEEGTADFMKNFLREAGENVTKSREKRQASEVKTHMSEYPFDMAQPTLFVSIGGTLGGQSAGACMMHGDPDVIDALGKATIKFLPGAKGGGRNGKFQLKIPAGLLSENNIKRLHQLVKDTTEEVLREKVK